MDFVSVAGLAWLCSTQSDSDAYLCACVEVGRKRSGDEGVDDPILDEAVFLLKHLDSVGVSYLGELHLCSLHNVGVQCTLCIQAITIRLL